MAEKRITIEGLGPVKIVTTGKPGTFLASGSRVLDWKAPWEVEFTVRKNHVVFVTWSMHLEDSARYYRAVHDGLQAALRVP
ncbi:MAG: hypothetical protein Q8Q85_09760 [Gemmatimonadales bacterium]|nr:hypothetical protein [Gemmatimonadales bacterium]